MCILLLDSKPKIIWGHPEKPIIHLILLMPDLVEKDSPLKATARSQQPATGKADSLFPSLRSDCWRMLVPPQIVCEDEGWHMNNVVLLCESK